MDEEISLPQEVQLTPRLRTYYGDERRRPCADPYDGVERRIPDPPCEQDLDREAPPN
jgi:hypothetical protein